MVDMVKVGSALVIGLFVIYMLFMMRKKMEKEEWSSDQLMNYSLMKE